MIALSFGGGRQTTALVILAVQGEIPKPDLVVFADTGWEWPETYDYIERYMKPLLAKEGIPFEVVRGKDREYTDLYEWLWGHRFFPSFNSRARTDKFKVRPLLKRFKEKDVDRQWIGFSADEADRAFRASQPKGIIKSFPLIESGITVHDCEGIVEKFGWPFPPRSACIFCAFQHPTRARLLSERHPALFEMVGKLEDRVVARRPGWYILGNKPWRSWAGIQPNLFGENWTYGCQDGYCFR